MKYLNSKKRIIVFMMLVFITCGQHAFAASNLAEEIKAKSAILMDENGMVLFEKNSHEQLPPASVTKVMTLLLTVEAVNSGKIKLDDLIITSENAWRQGGSQIWLEKGESLSVREMLIALAVVSANDAAVALMEHIYGTEAAAVEALNIRAQELGLKNTHFANVNGLPVENHYMSAYDTALIVKEAVKHPLFMEVCGIKEHWLRNGKNWLVNTNKLLWWYEGADGLKTGWTDEAKYCFAGTAKRDGLRLISVVFAAPEPRSHLKESMKLLDWGFARYSSHPVVKKADLVTKLPVNRGVASTVNLVAGQELSVLAEKGEKEAFNKEIVLEQDCTAPIEEGKKYGELILLKHGKVYGKVDLLAETGVDKADFLDTLQAMFVRFISI